MSRSQAVLPDLAQKTSMSVFLNCLLHRRSHTILKGKGGRGGGEAGSPAGVNPVTHSGWESERGRDQAGEGKTRWKARKRRSAGRSFPLWWWERGGKGRKLMVQALFLPPFPSLPSKHNPPTSHLKGVAAEFKLFYAL